MARDIFSFLGNSMKSATPAHKPLAVKWEVEAFVFIQVVQIELCSLEVCLQYKQKEGTAPMLF